MVPVEVPPRVVCLWMPQQAVGWLNVTVLDGNLEVGQTLVSAVERWEAGAALWGAFLCPIHLSDNEEPHLKP